MCEETVPIFHGQPLRMFPNIKTCICRLSSNKKRNLNFKFRKKNTKEHKKLATQLEVIKRKEKRILLPSKEFSNFIVMTFKNLEIGFLILADER